MARKGTLAEQPKFLSVPEVAERLSVTERFVRRLVFEKRIPYTKLGEGKNGHVRIAEADLNAYIESCRVTA